MTIPVYQLGGLQLNLNPMLEQPGQLIRAVNVETYPYGAIRKRGGYSTFLGTPDTSQITSLFDWHQDGTTFFLYRFSGGKLYYSSQGTTAWALAGNGTLTTGAQIGHVVSYHQGSAINVLMIGDGTAATRHSTDGTSFTNTTSAPIARHFADYQGRVYAGGTASDEFFSTSLAPTDWTTDSSSFVVPGGGKINSNFKASDRLVMGKTTGAMSRWDGFNLVDMATDLGPTATNSIGNAEDIRLWLNRNGFFTSAGDRPQLISNPIERLIYNRNQTGIAGTAFDNAPSTVHYYDYFSSVGTVQDDLTNEPVANAVIKYNFQKDDWYTWQLAHQPTAFLSFKDNTQTQQLIFGNASGQVYQFDTTSADAANPISAVIEMVIHGGSLKDKLWKYLTLAFNPGCQAQVQIAVENTFHKQNKKWVNLGDASSGKVEYKFKEARGVFLYLKIIESSTAALFNWYGGEVDFEVEPDR